MSIAIKPKFEATISLGHVFTALVFAAGCVAWYTTQNITIQQLRANQEDAKVERREINNRINGLVDLINDQKRFQAEQRKDNEWILKSLERLQYERGITPPPRQ